MEEFRGFEPTLAVNSAISTINLSSRSACSVTVTRNPMNTSIGSLLINLFLTFVISDTSIGGHIGGAVAVTWPLGGSY